MNLVTREDKGLEELVVSRSLEGLSTLLLHSLEGSVRKMYYNSLVDHLVL